MTEKNINRNIEESDEKLAGSKTDPQKTEMEGLKKGGVEPNVHPDDKAKDEKGRTDN